MQTNEREIVLLELAYNFLSVDDYLEAEYCLEIQDFHSVECNILIKIDDLFENEEINFENAGKIIK